MIIDITDHTWEQIKNPVFASYATVYLDIYEDFMKQASGSGIAIDPNDYEVEKQELLNRLRKKGGVFRNNDRSLYVNAISPACVACKKGIGSATFFVSLRCHRDCFYCFNPNQMHYDHYNQHKRELVKELEQIHDNGQRMSHLAITGGEPLLHKDEIVECFEYAREKLPDTYQRLYTCGDQADEAILERLKAAGLDEIRFSIRMHDLEKGHQHTLDRIALAREYIPTVMVEMPILPGTLEVMKKILLELDELQIHSINLLEFCFPFINADEFNRRSFKAKMRPYRTMYNYWYAGGIPIAQSELTCLSLLEFAIDEGLTIGVHYCSLENKLTGQNYQQNHDKTTPDTAYFSERDFLLKSAKVFGRDISRVKRRLQRNGYGESVRNRDHDFLDFHVSQIPVLRGLNVEIGISTSTMETRSDGDYLRELKVDLTYPDRFDPVVDV